MTYRKTIVGIIIYVSPWVQVRKRNEEFPEYKGQSREKIELVNKDIVRIARIIVAPKFRGAGLAVKLVKETMPLTGKRIIETIAAMPKYNPFFEKAGMKNLGVGKMMSSHKKILETIKALSGVPALMHSPNNRRKFLEELDNGKRNIMKDVLMKNLKALSRMGNRGKNDAIKYRQQLRDNGLQSLLGNLLPVERVYLYWLNKEIDKT